MSCRMMLNVRTLCHSKRRFEDLSAPSSTSSKQIYSRMASNKRAAGDGELQLPRIQLADRVLLVGLLLRLAVSRQGS